MPVKPFACIVCARVSDPAQFVGSLRKVCSLAAAGALVRVCPPKLGSVWFCTKRSGSCRVVRHTVWDCTCFCVCYKKYPTRQCLQLYYTYIQKYISTSLRVAGGFAGHDRPALANQGQKGAEKRIAGRSGAPPALAGARKGRDRLLR